MIEKLGSSGVPAVKTMNTNTSTVIALPAIVLLGAALAWTASASAQSPCVAQGYRVVARRWDAVLKLGWELRQNCAHPEWPARSVAIDSPQETVAVPVVNVNPGHVAALNQPLLVRAGDQVRLWMQDNNVRIEISGMAEQSARGGERVMVRIMHQSDDAGLTVERIAGVVRSAGDVEMER